jgi:CTD kinase subunit beta
MYPPHALALGCIYVAALLSSFEEPNQPAKLPPPVDPHLMSNEELAAILGQEGPWESQFKVRAEDLDGTWLAFRALLSMLIEEMK